MIFTALTDSIFTMHMILLRKMGQGNGKLCTQREVLTFSRTEMKSKSQSGHEVYLNQCLLDIEQLHRSTRGNLEYSWFLFQAQKIRIHSVWVWLKNVLKALQAILLCKENASSSSTLSFTHKETDLRRDLLALHRPLLAELGLQLRSLDLETRVCGINSKEAQELARVWENKIKKE